MRQRILTGVLILCVGLAGCGAAGGEKKAESSASSSSAGQETEKEGENRVILDDETAHVELTGVFAVSPDKKDTETVEPAAGIVFSVTNHGEKEIVMDMKNLKIGDQTAVRILMKGDIIEPEDTQEYRYGVALQGEEGKELLEEQLLTVDDMIENGISGEIHLVSMEGETGKAEFAFSGGQLPKK